MAKTVRAEDPMMARDYAPLLAELEQAYSHYSPVSRALNDDANRHLVDGGSHSLRLVQPFPPRIASAQGAWLKDEDGHSILDFWQGHLVNILGHNPKVVTDTLARAFSEGYGLQTGFTERLQSETAALLCRQTGAGRVRFTTSGTLATMYTILMARAFTNRNLVMKVGGGWHGAQPWALKGINFSPDGNKGFQKVESEGVPSSLTDQVVVSGFNDPELLHEHFRQYGEELACFIVEPFIGVGGFKAATREYLQEARKLTQRYGALLVFDEVIAGFRFRAGNAGRLYDVEPDLATYGKIMGGGMPVAAVAGRAEVMDLVGRAKGTKVKFSGGTYSAHPASLLAAKTLMAHLVEHETEIYPYLAQIGERTRKTIENAFAQEGILAHCTGEGNDALPGSSMFMIHFPYRQDARLERPEDWSNPEICDITLSHRVLDLALLVHDVFMLHSHGAVSTAHSEADIDLLGQACQQVARRIKPYL